MTITDGGRGVSCITLRTFPPVKKSTLQVANAETRSRQRGYFLTLAAELALHSLWIRAASSKRPSKSVWRSKTLHKSECLFEVPTCPRVPCKVQLARHPQRAAYDALHFAGGFEGVNSNDGPAKNRAKQRQAPPDLRCERV